MTLSVGDLLSYETVFPSLFYSPTALSECFLSVFGRMKCHSTCCGIDRLLLLKLKNGPYRLICGTANALSQVSSENYMSPQGISNQDRFLKQAKLICLTCSWES